MRVPAAVAALLVVGCSLQARPVTGLPPLERDGEVYVYLSPLPREADSLAFTLSSISLQRDDGTEHALEVLAPEVSGAKSRGQRLVAFGRLPAGDYQAFLVKASKATTKGSQGKVDLIPSAEPTRRPLRFRVGERRAVVVALALDYAASTGKAPEFSPTFAAEIPAKAPWQLVGYSANTDMSSLTVFDKQSRLVTGVVATGREPRGMALDPRANRLYVALSGADAIDVVDVVGSEVVSRINLAGGSRPRDLVLAPDGKLVVINPGSRTVSFVDPLSTQEVSRVPVGEDPWSILLDRGGQRAYVLNRRSNNISVIDVANRLPIRTVPTDPEPLWSQMNRSGDRLYVICAGSAFLTSFSLPSLEVVKRVHIGLGASSLKVDPRTDLIYVGKRDDDRLSVYEPFQFLSIDEFDVPGPVTYMAIDDVDNTLFALIPSLQRVAVIDLTSRRILAEFDVGRDPFEVTLSGARN
jgi:YVTN family beta-propeller protein